jgi:hypothetical protein
MSSNPSEFSRKFTSLVAIPIDGRLERDVIAHRRLLCHIAETFFSIWLVAFESSRAVTRTTRETFCELRSK